MTTQTKGEIKAGVEKALDKGMVGPQNEETKAPKLLTEKQQLKVKELLKDDKLTPVLSKDDKKFCAQHASTASDEVHKKGGLFDLQAAVERSKFKLANVPFDACLRAERAHGDTTLQGTAVRVAYYNALVKEMEGQAQLSERKQRPERDDKGALIDRTTVVPVKELLGDHWVAVVSKGRRALMAGLLPSEFAKATAFFDAGTPRNKGRKPGGSTTVGDQANKGQTAATGTAPASEAERAASEYAKSVGVGELAANALAEVIKRVKECDLDADIQVAMILTECAKQLVALKAGTWAPESEQSSQDDDAGSKAALQAS